MCELSELINVTLSLVGSELTSIGNEIIETSFSHPSLRRIILLKRAESRLYPFDRAPPVKLIFPSAKLIYVSGDFHGEKIDQLCYQVRNRTPLCIKPQYHVRYLDLKISCWRMKYLIDLLVALPLLVSLKITGSAYLYFWLHIDTWETMLQHLKALQYVNIDIYTGMPIAYRIEMVNRFNKMAAEKIDTCKRINLTAGERNRRPGVGLVQISASLNMN